VIRVIVVDDEIPAIDRIKKLLKIYSDIDIVGEAHDGLAALTLIEGKKPDVVFLDIDMPELSGLEVAKTLGMNGPPIIFVTAYDEYALSAFESNTVDYLVKPINESRLQITIEKIRKSLIKKELHLDSLLANFRDSGRPVRLAVKIGMKYEVFDPTTISAAISQDHYTSLVVDGRELLSDDSLESICARLDPTLFIRVHRGAILNVKYLKELRREGDRKYSAILSDKLQTQILVSRERLPQLKKFLGLD
jgi:two-component system LytT family response regulator